jgi:holo-[acyl-carrier protein] synthase
VTGRPVYAPIFDPEVAGPCEAGIDAIEPARVAALIARWGERFLARVFTPAERTACQGRPTSLAARFAAKEAVSKALGTGVGAVAWREIEILANPRGRPVLVLHGAAAARAEALGLRHWSVSLTHLADLALALVVATKDPRESDERRATSDE